MYLCLCKGVTADDVRRAAHDGHRTAEALILALGLRDPECCGRCAEEIEEFVALAVGADGAAAAHLALPHAVRHSPGADGDHPLDSERGKLSALRSADLLREVGLQPDLLDGL